MTTTLKQHSKHPISKPSVKPNGRPSIKPGAKPSVQPGTKPSQKPNSILRVEPWVDPVCDPMGHDPQSRYVELFWLPILGPSSTFLLRRLSALLDDAGTSAHQGIKISRYSLAREVGIINWEGTNSPFNRALKRLCDFNLAIFTETDQLYLRRAIPPLSHRLTTRLPPTIQAQLKDWKGR